MKLNQVVAIVTGTKSQAQREITDIHKKSQQAALMMGLERRYTPLDEEGESLPDESKRIQYTAHESIREARKVWTKLWDMVATQDHTNAEAYADVLIDDTPILRDVNITHLIFLEKQLNDVKTFVTKLPTLDPADKWEYDSATDAYATEPVKSIRTKKVLRNHVKSEATKEHPAQVEVYSEDVQVGTWHTIKYSGALPMEQKKLLLERVEILIEAVKKAREEANMVDTVDYKVAHDILSYLFA